MDFIIDGEMFDSLNFLWEFVGFVEVIEIAIESLNEAFFAEVGDYFVLADRSHFEDGLHVVKYIAWFFPARALIFIVHLLLLSNCTNADGNHS